MRQTGSSQHSIHDVRLIGLALFVAALATLCLFARTATVAGASGAQPASPPQRRRQGRPTRRPPARTPARDYSKYSHNIEGHFKDCASCHAIKSLEKPDLKEYPDHPSCVNCHRQQFFRGARPTICSDCHTAISPRSGARFPFPKQSVASQFTDIFPHASHIKSTSLALFKRVLGKDDVKTQDSCTYCHKTDQRAVKPQTGAAANAFAPAAGTFMTTPTSHATCFQCHWQKGVEGKDIEPLANQCSGCHNNTVAPALRAPAATATAIPATTPAEMKIIPAVAFIKSAALDKSWPPRISPKFAHELAAHKTKTNDEGKEVPITCLQCHTSVRKSATLENLRLKENKVQLPACATSACHTAISGPSLKLSVYNELRERDKASKKNETFECALCHVAPLSTDRNVPCSHYAVVYETAVKENKTKGIEAITPPRCSDQIKKDAK